MTILQKSQRQGLAVKHQAFFKLLFAACPAIFTKAINQMTFVPGILNQDHLKWIRKRKIIYIPKTNQPKTPADYRPLSMLEVLYKIPMRIYANRISNMLPNIIGKHQFGFMKQKGIQQPILLTNQITQIAKESKQALQIISFDIEKAFDKNFAQSNKASIRGFWISPDSNRCNCQFSIRRLWAGGSQQ